ISLRSKTPIWTAKRSRYAMCSLFRNSKAEIRSTSRSRFHPNFSAVAFGNALANRESEARSWELIAVQPFEEAENGFVMFRLDADAIVRNTKLPIATIFAAR